MEFRNHPAVQGRRDAYPVDPRALKIDGNYNVREMDSAETLAHIADLKQTIADSGVRTPLEVRLVGEDIFIVSGHCRHAAVMALIAEGRDDIKSVPCIPEPKGTSEEERTLNLHLSNATNPLSPLAKAKIVKRLKDFGWKDDEVARRMGWKSVASVKDALEALELPAGVKQRIRDGKISTTTARHLAKSDLSAEEQEKLIDANLEENKRIKGDKKRHKVTAKTMKRDAAKAKPPAAAKPAAAPSQAPEPRHDDNRAAPSPMAASHLEPLPGEQTGPVIVDGLDVGSDPADLSESGALPAVTSRRDLKTLLDALLPFARHAEINDLNERKDDDVIEVSVRDIKRAAQAWFNATGQTTTSDNVDAQEHRDAA